MNKRLRYTTWLILFFIFLPLGAADTIFVYPNVGETVTFVHTTERDFAYDAFVTFIHQWQENGTEGDFTLMQKIDAQNQLVGTLKSILRMQTAQLDQLHRQTRPVFSIPNDPSNPVYAFRLMTTPAFSSTPPIGMVDKSSLSHQFGLNFGITQKLPIAGSLNLALKHGLSITSEDNGPWKWKQSPSVALTFQQPLGLGEGIFDTKYGKKIEEKQIIQRISALDAVQQSKDQIYLQLLTLQSRRQTLLENRWLSNQQALLADQALLDAQLDLDIGRISQNQLIRQQSVFEQSMIQIAELDREIGKVNSSIETILGEPSSALPLIDVKVIAQLMSYKSDESLVKQALLVDSDYLEADRDLQLAQLDRSLGNPSDAPMLSLSVQYSPYYTPTVGNGLLKSFDELFSTSEPTVSLSVGFMASDLARSASKMSKVLMDEQILQASLRKKQALQAVTQRGIDYELLINKEFSALNVLFDDYKFAENELEISRIRSTAGLENQNSLRQKELGVYNAAFAVLQKLRSMHVLAVELEIFTGSFRL